MALQPPIRLSQLRDIAWSLWDPIGLRSLCGSWENCPAADEYDGYMLHAIALLRDGARDEQVAVYLVESEAERMGLTITPETEKRARRTVAALANVAI